MLDRHIAILRSALIAAPVLLVMNFSAWCQTAPSKIPDQIKNSVDIGDDFGKPLPPPEGRSTANNGAASLDKLCNKLKSLGKNPAYCK
jgi:hypothetical protein